MPGKPDIPMRLGYSASLVLALMAVATLAACNMETCNLDHVSKDYYLVGGDPANIAGADNLLAPSRDLLVASYTLRSSGFLASLGHSGCTSFDTTELNSRALYEWDFPESTRPNESGAYTYQMSLVSGQLKIRKGTASFILNPPVKIPGLANTSLSGACDAARLQAALDEIAGVYAGPGMDSSGHSVSSVPVAWELSGSLDGTAFKLTWQQDLRWKIDGWSF